MVNNFDENALQQAKEMANSPAGRELMQKMQNMDPATLQKLMAQASAGDFSQLTKSKEFQELLRQMGGK